MQKVSKSFLSLCCFLILASVVLMGCKGDEPVSQETTREKPLVGVLIYRADDTYISYVSEALEKKFAEVGADLLIHDAKNEQYTQDEQLLALLGENVDALAVNLVDVQSASFVVDKIKKANIPVVFFNREPSLDVLKIHEKARFVGTVLSDAGRMQGEIIARWWRTVPQMDRNKDGRLQYIMIQATSDNPEALARTEFSVRHARESGVELEQVGNAFLCGWDEQRSYQTVRDALPQLIGSFELIIANNDAMALGAVRALQEFGYNTGDKTNGKYIPVIGVDAVPQALDAIRAGFMSGTVKQDSALMAEVVVTLLMNALNTRPELENIDLKWDESGIALRVPYSAIGDD